MKFYFFVLVGYLNVVTVVAQDCELKKVKDGISVYTCKAKDSKLKSIRAELKLSGKTLTDLTTLLDDIDSYKYWQYKMIASQVLKRISGEEVIYRTVVEAPWPASNRELIVHKKLTHDEPAKTLLIEVKTIDYAYPVDDDLVRVPYQLAVWHVTEVADGLNIVYTLSVDPGGSIPAWIINLGVAEGPFHSFGKLKEKLGIR
ncbi:START domain-containing protein [Pseudochryseolinea flava]|nr:START domain-containing protein [Pseudochryseolinea flava]